MLCITREDDTVEKCTGGLNAGTGRGGNGRQPADMQVDDIRSGRPGWRPRQRIAERAATVIFLIMIINGGSKNWTKREVMQMRSSQVLISLAYNYGSAAHSESGL